MAGKIATIAITVFWLAMMGWLVKREVAPVVSAYRRSQREGYARLERLAARRPVSQSGIYFGKQRIGYYVQELRKREDDLTLNAYCFMQLSNIGQEGIFSGLGALDTSIRSSARFSNKRLQEFTMFVATPPDAPPEVRVTGAPIGNELALTIKDPGGTRVERLPLSVGETLSLDMAPITGSGKLEVGRKWGVPTFSIQSRKSVMALAEVVAEEKIEIDDRIYDAYRVEVKYGEGVVSLTMVVWIGADGEALKQQVGPFTLQRETPDEDALRKLRRQHD